MMHKLKIDSARLSKSIEHLEQTKAKEIRRKEESEEARVTALGHPHYSSSSSTSTTVATSTSKSPSNIVFSKHFHVLVKSKSVTDDEIEQLEALIAELPNITIHVIGNKTTPRFTEFVRSRADYVKKDIRVSDKLWKQAKDRYTRLRDTDKKYTDDDPKLIRALDILHLMQQKSGFLNRPRSHRGSFLQNSNGYNSDEDGLTDRAFLTRSTLTSVDSDDESSTDSTSKEVLIDMHLLLLPNPTLFEDEISVALELADVLQYDKASLSLIPCYFKRMLNEDKQAEIVVPKPPTSPTTSPTRRLSLAALPAAIPEELKSELRELGAKFGEEIALNNPTLPREEINRIGLERALALLNARGIELLSPDSPLSATSHSYPTSQSSSTHTSPQGTPTKGEKVKAKEPHIFSSHAQLRAKALKFDGTDSSKAALETPKDGSKRAHAATVTESEESLKRHDPPAKRSTPESMRLVPATGRVDHDGMQDKTSQGNDDKNASCLRRSNSMSSLTF